MRSTYVIAGFFGLLTNASFSQDCSNYYFLQQNQTIEMTIYNKKGNPDGKQVYTVSNVAKNGGNTTATVNSEMFSQKGKSIAKGHSEITVTRGIMMVDMTMKLPQAQQEHYANEDVKDEKIFI